MIGKRFRSLPFIFANDNYTLRKSGVTLQGYTTTLLYLLFNKQDDKPGYVVE